MPKQEWNIEGLIVRLETAYKKAQNDYIQLLFAEKYTEAMSQLSLMETINMHIENIGGFH